MNSSIATTEPDQRAQKRPRSGSSTPRATPSTLRDDEHQAEQGGSIAIQTTLKTMPNSPLVDLPLEILAEILMMVSSPADILAVARTGRFLHRTLGKPTSAFIWRAVRRSMLPEAMPDVPLPLPRASDAVAESEQDFLAHIASEPAYAAFVFDEGPCHICKRMCNSYRRSFSLDLRLCQSIKCRDGYILRTHTRDGILNVAHSTTEVNLLNWATRAETSSWAYASVQNSDISLDYWPSGLVHMRVQNWTSLQRAYLNAIHEGGEVLENFFQMQEAKVEDVKRCMKFYVDLHRWWIQRLKKLTLARLDNLSRVRTLSEQHGWDFAHLIRSATFGRLVRLRNLDFEPITEEDYLQHKDTIAKELLGTKVKIDAKEKRAWDAGVLDAAKRAHNRVRSMNNQVAVPTLSVFMKLPIIVSLRSTTPGLGQSLNTSSVRALLPPSAGQSSKKMDLTKQLKTSPYLNAAIDDQVRQWCNKAKDDLLEVLGLPPRWQTANLKALHPVERVTARFICKVCRDADPLKARHAAMESGHREQGGPGDQMDVDAEPIGDDMSGQQSEGRVVDFPGPSRVHGLPAGVDRALDFKAVCGHECPCIWGNAKQDLEARGGWDARMFVRDDKAIAAINQVLLRTKLDAELSSTHEMLRSHGNRFLCLSCEGGIILPFDNIAEHSHRHDEMIITSTQAQDLVSMFARPVEVGLAKKLLAKSNIAVHLQGLKNYGCRSCENARKAQKLVMSQRVEASGASPADAGSAAVQTVPGDQASVEPATDGNVAPPPGIKSLGAISGSVLKKKKGKGKETAVADRPRLFTFNGLRSHLKAKHGVSLVRDEDFFHENRLDWNPRPST